MKSKSWIQIFAIGYSLAFFGIVGLNYVPGIHDAHGNMFGLFHLDFIDDALHLGSAIWAIIAGLVSTSAAVFYFRWFGLAYFLDGLLGLTVGKGYLDFAIFKDTPAVVDFMTKFQLNIPHLIIGGTAILIGFILSKKDVFRS